MCSMKSNGWIVYPAIAGNLVLIAWALAGSPPRAPYLACVIGLFGLSIALFASNAHGDRLKGCMALVSTVAACLMIYAR